MARPCGLPVAEDMRYACDSRIRLCIRLSRQPPSTKSRASQASSSGCVGGVPARPKLSVERTIPRPKYSCHRRLTITRAVNGLSLSAIHLANSRRSPIVGRSPNSASIGFSELRTADEPVNETGTAAGAFPPRIVKNRGSTRLPGAATLPRISTRVSRRGGPHSRTDSAFSNGIEACSFLSLASSSTSGLRAAQDSAIFLRQLVELRARDRHLPRAVRLAAISRQPPRPRCQPA